jgi:UDP-glucose 4-epimerase
MRAIVTGGAGFIGSHLVDALVARGDEVLVLDNLSSGRQANVHTDAKLVVGDVTDPATVATAFEETEAEVCFHLAAQVDVRVSVDDPLLDFQTNVGGTLRVLEAARGHGTRVVFASSGGAVYGEADGPLPEDAPPHPLAPYGASKLAAEEYLAVYNRLHGGSHVSLRYGNVYGPRQDPSGEAGVVAIFLGRLAREEELHVYGDGRQTRDYVYVDDVVEATLAAVGKSGVFNVGTGAETSVLELAEACRRVTGIDVETVLEPARLGEIERSVLDPSLTERELGFRAGTSLDDGLAATWEFIREAEGERASGAN